MRTARFIFASVLIAGMCAVPALAQPQTRGIAETANEPAQGRKYAVIVGIDAYQDEGIGDLNCAAQDATAIHRALTEAPDGFNPAHTMLLTDAMPPDRRPTRNNVLKYLNAYISLAGPQDTVLVYFAGHGTTENGRLHLLPADASVSLLADTAIPYARLLEMLEGSAARRKVLLLDACHSGAGRSLNRMTNATVEQLQQASEGMVVLASCGPEEVSYEMPDSDHGAFTHFLLEGLEGNADVNTDGLVGAKELSTYTWERTRLWAAQQGFEQNPWDHSKVSGDIILANVHSVRGEPAKARVRVHEGGRRAGDTRMLDLGGEVELELVWIPPGTFTMGSPYDEEGRSINEGPQHEVTLAGFWMARYEVTNGQYRRYDAHHHSGGYLGQTLDTDNQPVVNVSWEDAMAFCAWLSTRTGESCGLPSEAQWEYACRAGSDTATPWGMLDDATGDYANVADRTAQAAWPDWESLDTADGHDVSADIGSFKPNSYGLHDMIGNAAEWCADWYDAEYYRMSPEEAPGGPASGSARVYRGGSWYDYPLGCRSANRDAAAPDHRHCSIGFRVAIPGGDSR